MNRLVRTIAKLIKRLVPARLFRLVDPLGHGIEAWLAAAINGFPASRLKVIGVTGTNGKTTTCLLVANVLKAAGYRVGLSTTALYWIGGKETANRRNVTVTDPWSLQRLLKRMVQAGDEWVVLEVTSHALHQHRVAGIRFQVAALTNISQDHLDYHQTMEAYTAAKAKLFARRPILSVLNRDEARLASFDRYPAGRKLYYSLEQLADITAKAIESSAQGSSFQLATPSGQQAVRLALPGQFNIANALAAAGVGEGLSVDLPKIAAGLAAVTVVPGRMERIEAGQPFTVVVDYAITPDALEKLFSALHDLKGAGRLLAVYGATGKRDKGKRQPMGEVGARLCDMVVLTDDEPYTEDAASIRRAVQEGLIAAGGRAGETYLEVPDRRQAIRTALERAQPGDIVALTGIGHQQYRTIGTQEVPWDERSVAREVLAELGYKLGK